MTFYKKGYYIVRNIISEDDVFKINTRLNKRDDGMLYDEQVPNTPSFYNDELISDMQLKLLPKIEEHTGLELFKTYNFARLYKKDDILLPHTDREACEVSITLDLGGSKWPIWVLDRDGNNIKIDLNPGDALIYRGCEINHWRERFEDDLHSQVFMHYVDKFGPYAWAKDDTKQ